MQVLHELLHSLSKDEKRLYNQHKRNGRFQKIYEVYMANPVFTKQIDKDLYDREFGDVSKPFYSMQKRSLFDDVVTVLLSYSNLQIPEYKLPRALAKAQILLERNVPGAAVYYLEEARQQTDDGTDPTVLLSLVRTQKKAEEQLGQATFSSYLNLIREEQALVQRLASRQDLPSLREALRLLKRNLENFPEEVVAHHAEEIMQAAKAQPTQGQLDLFHRLEIENLYYTIRGQADEYHRRVVQAYKDIERQEGTAASTNYFRLLNEVLRNALRVGDFLLLSGLIYKTNKLLEHSPEAIDPQFLPDYLESCALYHFYENELPTALRELEQLLKQPNLPKAQAERCLYYYLAMLVAAHLPQQAVDALAHHLKQYPGLAAHPANDLFRAVLAVDMHDDADEVSLRLEKSKLEYRKDPALKAYLECAQAIQAYLERKPQRGRALHFFPEDWEPIMRVDLWLEAKLENKFYYNLIAEDWQNRKTVFN
jgi:hypothetical protein